MNESSTHLHVLIVAAGIGSRFDSKSDLPKQYHLIGNKSVLAHSIESFNDIACDGIMVVTHADDCWWPKTRFQSAHQIKQCTGGDRRRHSVLKGLKAIQQKADDKDWVMVHDAARPCVSQKDIELLKKQCESHELGGILVKPISDTIKLSTDGNHCSQTLNRDQLYAALTPQMFRLGALLEYLQQADSKLTTDEASAFEQAGLKPLMVQGNGQNIKITYPEDLSLAQFYLQQQGRL